MDDAFGEFGAGDVDAADVVGEVFAVVEGEFLGFAVGEMGGDGHDDGLAAGFQGTPSGDAAEEVEGFDGVADGDFDGVWEGAGVGVWASAAEDDEVSAEGIGGGIDDVEGDAGDGDDAEAAEAEGVSGGLAGGVEALAGVCGEGAGEVEDAVFGGALGEVGEDVAKGIGPEGFEAFGHEGAAGVGAGFDGVGGDFDFAGDGAEDDAGVVLAGDETGVEGAVVGFEVVEFVSGIDLAVGIDDGDEELFGAVGAEAIEGGADFFSFAAEAVADGAGEGELFFAADGIAALGDFGKEVGEEFFLIGAGLVEFVDEGGGAFGDFRGGVAAEAEEVVGAEEGEGRGVLFGGGDEGICLSHSRRR